MASPAAPHRGPGAPPRARPRGRPKGSFTQHRRLDALRALLLQRPRGMTLAEIAQALHVTTRSARRYLREVRREIELHRDAARPGGVRWRLGAEDRPRKIGLRRTQAYALLAARRLFEPMRGSALFEEIDLAVRDLGTLAVRPGRGPNAGVADAGLERRFLFLPRAPKSYASHAEELDVLFQAVADLRPVSCHIRDRAGKESRSTLHPYAMALFDDAIVAVARDQETGEIGAYELERLRDAVLSTTQRFELPADFDVEAYFQGAFGPATGKDKVRVVIDFAPSAADQVRSRRAHPTQRVSSLRGGGVRATMTVADPVALVPWVLGFGEGARVVEPDELRARVIGALRGALGLYRDRSGGS
jgi:predicted DNA-binding transcriptional regulator YafY